MWNTSSSLGILFSILLQVFHHLFEILYMNCQIIFNAVCFTISFKVAIIMNPKKCQPQFSFWGKTIASPVVAMLFLVGQCIDVTWDILSIVHVYCFRHYIEKKMAQSLIARIMLFAWLVGQRVSDGIAILKPKVLYMVVIMATSKWCLKTILGKVWLLWCLKVIVVELDQNHSLACFLYYMYH